MDWSVSQSYVLNLDHVVEPDLEGRVESWNQVVIIGHLIDATFLFLQSSASK